MADVAALRVVCPECGTSYANTHLKLKASPQDKAYVRCMCGRSLEVTFAHRTEVVPPPPQSWKDWLLRRKAEAEERRVIDVHVAARD